MNRLRRSHEVTKFKHIIHLYKISGYSYQKLRNIISGVKAYSRKTLCKPNNKDQSVADQKHFT